MCWFLITCYILHLRVSITHSFSLVWLKQCINSVYLFVWHIYLFICWFQSKIKKKHRRDEEGIGREMNINRWFFIGDSFTPSPAFNMELWLSLWFFFITNSRARSQQTNLYRLYTEQRSSCTLCQCHGIMMHIRHFYFILFAHTHHFIFRSINLQLS